MNRFNTWKCLTLEHFKMFKCFKCSKCFKCDWTLEKNTYKCSTFTSVLKHSKPVEHLKHLEHLEHLEHLKILKCSSIKHFQVLNQFKKKIIIFSLNHTKVYLTKLVILITHRRSEPGERQCSAALPPLKLSHFQQLTYNQVSTGKDTTFTFSWKICFQMNRRQSCQLETFKSQRSLHMASLVKYLFHHPMLTFR